MVKSEFKIPVLIAKQTKYPCRALDQGPWWPRVPVTNLPASAVLILVTNCLLGDFTSDLFAPTLPSPQSQNLTDTL